MIISSLLRAVFIFLFSVLTLQRLFAQDPLLDSFRLANDRQAPDTVRIDKLNQLIYRQSANNPGISLAFADSSVSFAKRIMDSSRLAYSLTRKGQVLYYAGDLSNALETYFAALRVKDQIGDSLTTWREYNNIALVLREQKYYQEALKYFSRAQVLLQHSSNANYEALLWNNIGMTQRALKLYPSAFISLNRALALTEGNSLSQTRAYSYNNLGNLQRDEKKFDLAIANYLKAITINNALGSLNELAKNNVNLGLAYLGQKNNEIAFEYIQRGSELNKKIGSIQLEIFILNAFSDYYEAIGNFKEGFRTKELEFKLSDSLSLNEKSNQFEQLKKLASIEKEVQGMKFLKQITAIQKQQIRSNRNIQIAGGVVLLLILALLSIALRNLKKNKKLTRSLSNRNKEIESLNSELNTINEELRAQRDYLEQTLNNLQQTQRHLLQAEKMASIGTLAAGIAHEINNPLNFIKGGIYGVESFLEENKGAIRSEDMAEINALLEGIHHGVDRSADIIRSLSHFISGNEQEQVLCNVHEAVENCLVILSSQFLNRIEIHRKYAGKKPVLRCNQGKLHQAILNILTNAIQAIEGEGTISIQSVIEGSNLKLSIEDNGRGIQPEHLNKIMDPFFSTRSPDKGVGLGLSISYQSIKEFGGSIDIDSAVNNGTRVLIELPLELQADA